MIDTARLFESVRELKQFTVTDNHLKLLRRAYVNWDYGENYGAPEIDCKRPYGNSSIELDIAEILEAPDSDWEWGGGERVLRPEAQDRYTRLHVETAIALQIALATGEFRPGRYARTKTWSIDWKRDESGQ
jgi:hypothetical protein